MRALVRDRYGPPEILRIEDLPVPSPTEDQIRIRVKAVGLNRSDWETLTGRPLYARLGGLFRPKNRVLGSDIAGVVEEVGANNTHFDIGEEVFGDIIGSMGGLAEHVCVRGWSLVNKPPEMTFEEAAALPQPTAIAVRGIIDVGQVASGQEVLINGAGGATGAFAMQLAVAAGARVTAVDKAHKERRLRQLGAVDFIDHESQSFKRSGSRFDLILDLVASGSAFRLRRCLKPGGRYLYVGGSVWTLIQVAALGRLLGGKSRQIRFLSVEPDRDLLKRVVDLVAKGDLRVETDQVVSLDHAPSAIQRIGEGTTSGRLVVTL